MIYIATAESDGSAVYFDIHTAERRECGLRVCGMVGDGGYEGEVLVETGHSSAVTFVDAWLGGTGFYEFFCRCGAEQLEQALIESVENLKFSHGRRYSPHGHNGGRAAEAEPSWLALA